MENLLRKYSLAANLAASAPNSQSTSTTGAKFYDSTNTLTNDNQINQGQSSAATTTTPDIRLVYNLNLTHVETTCCEEYELVQSVITKLIKDVKKEKELFVQSSQPAQSIDENAVGSSAKTIKSKFINTRRAKSPKSNATHLVQHDAQNAPINIVNNPSIGGGSSLSNANVISSSPVQSVNSQSLSNELCSSLNTNSPAVNSAVGEVETFMNPSATAAIIKDAKKNSSKFPFFTKILNKANNNS